MCDYCGCRQQPAIAELSDEHDRLLDLGYRLRRLTACGWHEEVLAIIDDQLGPLLRHHTDREERGIFTQLRANFEADARLDELEAEHRDIDARLDRVRMATDGWQETLSQLVTDLAQHIFDEEVDLFPYAMYELTPAQWDAVAEVHTSSAPVPS